MTDATEIRCPVCGASTSHRYNRTDSAIVQCQNNQCGLVFLETQPTDAQLQALYDSLYYPDDDTQPVLKPESDNEKLDQHARYLDAKFNLKGAAVLDVGCGSGNFMASLRAAGAEVVCGVEPNEVARNEAIQRGFETFDSISGLGEQKFDLVVMNDVIEHLRDPLADCRLLRQCLSPAGSVYIVTINLGGLKSRLKRENWDMVLDPTHLYFFDAMSLSYLIETAGYEAIKVDKHYVRFSHHGALRALFQRILVLLGLDSSLKILGQNPSATEASN